MKKSLAKLVVSVAVLSMIQAILVGSLTDNSAGTGMFQTIPEPSSTSLFLGAAALLFFVRKSNCRIAHINN
jgi:hypothetical protein